MQNKINEQIVAKLNELGLTISTCESMTGGAVGANLVLVEHASKCFLGSLTTYSTEAKTKLAKVKPETVGECGVISAACAQDMALGCQRTFKSDIAISVTGNASFANPMENQPSGTAYICIAFFDQLYDFKFVSTYTNRVDTINQCVAYCYNQLWEIIKDLKK